MPEAKFNPGGLPRISQEEWFKLMGKPAPSKEGHGTEQDILENLKPVKLTNWRLQGNVLMADSDLGPYAHRIPSDLIMRGTDLQGLPILTKVNFGS